MTRISLADRRKTAPQIGACLQEHYSTAVPVSTVQQRPLEVGLKAYRAQRKPRLTLAHGQNRLEFARKHRDWSASDWSRVVFSDESRFLLYRSDGLPYVKHRPGEAYRDDCVQPTLKHGGGGLMVWGCMSESGVGELVLVKGRLCASDYISLLKRALPASVRCLGLHNEYIFQQDNASCHTAKLTKNWMARKRISLLHKVPISIPLSIYGISWVDNLAVELFLTTKNFSSTFRSSGSSYLDCISLFSWRVCLCAYRL